MGGGGGNSGYFARITIKFTLPSCEKENAPRTSKYFIFEWIRVFNTFQDLETLFHTANKTSAQRAEVWF